MIVDAASVQSARVVLASGSPRRVEILNTLLGLGALVYPSTFPEDLDKSQFTPKTYVQENARQKALEVYGKLSAEEKRAPSLVIGADTVVVLDDQILEKPSDEAAAIEMLSSLSGREHEVCTGVALLYAPQDDGGTDPHVVLFVETTTVCFAELSAGAVKAYVDTGEPFDKAGGYGYQSKAAGFVQGIKGCYWNVRAPHMHACIIHTCIHTTTRAAAHSVVVACCCCRRFER